jgi:hypothetical protein
MQKAFVAITLLVLAGLTAVPTYAAELRVTGFFDNILPHASRNLSMADLDLTNNKDTMFTGRERSRLFFNFIASDDLRGIFALEIDQTYGAPSRNLVGSRCVPDISNATTIQGQRVLTQNFDACGFRNQIDNNVLELKNLYVDFRVPQVPIGNRWQIGGIPADVTPLHPHLLYTMDSGGGNVKFDFTDQVSLLVHYIQLEEDLDVNKNNTLVNSTVTRRGEDYLTGGTLMLKPIPGLDLHLIGIYGHLQQPFGADLTGGGGPFASIQTTNITTESRYYLGFDSRYRLGDLSIEPTFIYLLGTRNFNSASQAVTGFPSTNIRAFETQLNLLYTAGPWFLAAKGAYTSGNKASDDINNNGFAGTSRSNVNIFRPMGVDGFHRFGEYLEIIGRAEADGVNISIGDFGTPGERGTWDRYGLIVGVGKAEYSWTDALVLEGAAGAYFTAQKTGCAAVLRTGPNGACATTGATILNTGQTFNPRNFTGNSSYLGTEVDVGFRYTIMPGLIWQQRFGWAFLGNAFAINNRNAQDAWVFVNRVLYTF